MSRLDELRRDRDPDMLAGSNAKVYDLVRYLWPNSSLEFARRVEYQLKDQLGAERCRVCGCTRRDTCKLNARVYPAEGSNLDLVAAFRTRGEAERFDMTRRVVGPLRICQQSPHPFYCRLETADLCSGCSMLPARVPFEDPAYKRIPKHLRAGLFDYFSLDRITTGGFLKAVLEGAIDEAEFKMNPRIDLPALCHAIAEIDPYRMAHGSPEIVRLYVGEEKYKSWH